MRKRNRQVIVRMNDLEYIHLARQAEIAGIKIAPFVRALVMGSQLRPRPPEAYASLLRELSAIGNNINQVAKIANMEKSVPPEVITQMVTTQMAIWRKVKDL